MSILPPDYAAQVPSAPPEADHQTWPEASAQSTQLPDRPVISIRPGHRLGTLNLRELWAYRDLLRLLTWRDVQVRYKQTLLGVAWAVLQPLFSMVVFWIIFGELAKIPSDGLPYPVFAFAGMVVWTFFANAVTNSANSLVGNASLVSKVYFPRVIIPAAAVLAGLVDFVIGLAVLGLMAVGYAGSGGAVGVGWSLLLVPPLTLLLTLAALATGLWTSALNVKYRDVRYAMPFVIQLWLFMTPIIYPASMVPERWRWMLALNPLAGLAEAFRAALFDRPIDWGTFALSSGTTLLLLFSAAYAFRRMEKSFADVI